MNTSLTSFFFNLILTIKGFNIFLEKLAEKKNFTVLQTVALLAGTARESKNKANTEQSFGWVGSELGNNDITIIVITIKIIEMGNCEPTPSRCF